MHHHFHEYPRSLYQQIVQYPDQAVPVWIARLSDLMSPVYVANVDFVCCLGASITSTEVGKQTITTDDHQGSIINSPIQNVTFIPLVSPLLLHKLITKNQHDGNRTKKNIG